MVDVSRKAQYEKRFAAIESSFRIEGMDPSGDRLYEAAKAAVLSGEMTPKQALAFAVKRSASARVFAVASR
jgi:hypothetical protein